MTAVLGEVRADAEPTATWLVEAPFGGVEVSCTDRGVTRVHFLGADSWSAVPCGEQANADRFAAERRWVRDLLAELRAYLRGDVVRFDNVRVDLTSQPPFRRRVLEECRRVGYGETTSYAELARRAGNPAAVRAVGSAMSHNPVPIIIPCHRVLRSDGSLGGFGGPGGMNLKEQLLEMERLALGRM